ncbi:MAG TPA: dTDP-6-deoxy-L-hexose 3-O-methyltransferase, partial [Gimesia maris]|nr:dTDP-6-deoxy-L-hexose 3-O-methyltransferase [Gimesia maris]
MAEKKGLLKGNVGESQNQSNSDLNALNAVEEYWESSVGSNLNKLDAFTKYVSRQSITKLLARYEIFQQQLEVNGSVVELGVHRGASLMAWAQFSAILEPVNYLRKIIGFDTFEGFPSLSEKDTTGTSEHLEVGGFKSEENAMEDLEKAIQVYNSTRYLNHISKVELVKGDISVTLPEYLEKNQHLIVSLLHLDADLYEPTKVALELLIPRMPKGAIIAFDELNMDLFPGETL